jgi:imidazolonepropionase-like amidohydrolase
VGGMWVVPGVSLHQEFDLLAKAGLTPLKVLQMTTLNGAEFLGKRTSMGTVELGKDANLVLLDANPVQSVANLHKINAVIRDGKFYSQETLEKMKKDSAAKMAAVTEATSSSHVH